MMGRDMMRNFAESFLAASREVIAQHALDDPTGEGVFFGSGEGADRAQCRVENIPTVIDGEQTLVRKLGHQGARDDAAGDRVPQGFGVVVGHGDPPELTKEPYAAPHGTSST